MALRLSVLFDGNNRNLKRSALGVNESLDSIKRTALSVGAAIGVAFSAATFTSFANQATSARNRIRDITADSREFAAVQGLISRAARETRSDIVATTELYARLSRAVGDTVGSNEELAAITATINKSFALSGATAQEASAAIIQLSQGLQAGVLRGDEFNSVAEQAPGILEAVAVQTGKTRAQLRDMAAEGKITSELLITSLQNYADEVDRRFQQTEASIGNALTIVNNGMIELVSDLDVFIGASTGAVLSANNIYDSLKQIGDYVSSGELTQDVDRWAAQFETANQSVGASLDALNIDLNKSTLLIEAFGDEISNLLGRALREFPSNITALGQMIGVGMGSLVDIGRAQGEAFAQVVGTRIAHLVDEAGIYFEELQDLAQFWDGDTFNLDAALAQADAVESGILDGIFKRRDEAVNASASARDAQISDIMAVRQATLDAYNQLPTATDPAANDPASSGSSSSSSNITGGASGDDEVFKKLQERYYNEEQLLAAHYLNELDIINTAFEQRKISEDQQNALIEQARAQHLDKLQQTEQRKSQMMILSGQQIFGGLTDLIGQFAGEQNAAYKAMFAITKGFAISQAVLNLSTAISNASAVPFPVNIGLMAEAFTTGTQLVSAIKGATFQGQAHDGLSRLPAANEGTFMLRRDEMVMNPRQRENFESMAEHYKQTGGKGGGNVVNINNQITVNAPNAEAGMEQRIAQSVEQAIEANNEQLREDFSNGGPMAQSLRGVA